LPNPTLRFGSKGSDVARAQQGLNRLPSARPRLTEDGVFGQLTLARAREFQSANALTPDGVIGPLTWQALLALVGSIVGGLPLPPAAPPSPVSNSLRPLVLIEAQKHVGEVDFSVLENGRPKGIDLVIEIFRVAANTAVTDAAFKGSQGEWVPQPLVGGQRKSWCGIFAVYCCRQVGIGLHWDLGRGGPVGPAGPLVPTKFSSSFVANLKPADIGMVATQQHHFLIESVASGPAPGLTTLDANLTWGQINRVNTHRVGLDNFNYYSLA
jgi:peptidoglycan hydrolase-like protein with peptidoglycan-binding domain